MIEQFIFDKISSNPALQALLSAGGGKYHIYPNKVPRGLNFNQALVFYRMGGASEYPTIKSNLIQFNIFAKEHKKLGDIADALYQLFDDKRNQVGTNIVVVYSSRETAEFDLETTLDNTDWYQRTVSYYFKIK